MANLRSRIVDLREVDTADLKDNEGNWRAHPLAQRNALAAVLHDVGIVDALLVYESTRQGGLTLLDGHLRAGDHPGKWPVLFLDLDDAEADIILASFDPLAAMAQTIPGALADLVEQAKTGATGDMQDVLDQMVADAGAELALLDGQMLVDPGPDIQRAQELIAKWEVVRGGLWGIPSLSIMGGEHRLMMGSSLREADLGRLFEDRVADMVFTDPPCGIRYDPAERNRQQGKRCNRFAGGIIGDGWEGDFSHRRWLTIVDRYYRGAIYVCGSVQMYPEVWTWFLNRHKREPTVIVWVKDGFSLTRRDYHRQHEFIFHGDAAAGLGDIGDDGGYEELADGRFIFYSWNARRKWLVDRGETDVWPVRRLLRKDYRHPTQKPTELITRAITNSCPLGGSVADFFGGSGETMVAAEQMGRLSLLMELDPRFVAVTLDRLAEMGLVPYRIG